MTCSLMSWGNETFLTWASASFLARMACGHTPLPFFLWSQGKKKFLCFFVKPILSLCPPISPHVLLPNPAFPVTSGFVKRKDSILSALAGFLGAMLPRPGAQPLDQAAWPFTYLWKAAIDLLCNLDNLYSFPKILIKMIVKLNITCRIQWLKVTQALPRLLSFHLWSSLQLLCGHSQDSPPCFLWF